MSVVVCRETRSAPRQHAAPLAITKCIDVSMCLCVCAGLVLGLVGPAGGAQYWDQEGLVLPSPRPRTVPALGARLLAALAATTYTDGDGASSRWRRRAPEEEAPREPADPNGTQPVRDKGREGAGAGTGASRIAVVGKCCPVGQNLSTLLMADATSHGEGEGGDEADEEDIGRLCVSSSLPFQPIFFDFNSTGIWDYDVNEWETIVGNPCQYGRYRLDPRKQSEDEFYLLRNGSLLAPFHRPVMLAPRDFCMEAFWTGAGDDPLVLPFICFAGPPPAPSRSRSGWVIFIALVMLMSVPFLIATSAAHGLVGEVWRATDRRHGRALAAHCACLAVGFLSLSITQLTAPALSHALCIIAAYTIQFSFLACFFWLNVLCFDVYLSVTTRPIPCGVGGGGASHISPEGELRPKQRGWQGVCQRWGGWRLWGWGAPILITLATLVLDRAPGLPLSFLKPNFGAEGCWFQSKTSTLLYFYGPVSLLLACNLVLFALTARALSLEDSALSAADALGSLSLGFTETDADRDPDTGLVAGVTSEPFSYLAPARQRWIKYRRIFKLCLALFLVMGLSWTLEVLSWLVGGASPLWYFSDLFNALQGITIFLIFMRPPVLTIVWEKLSRKFPWLPWRSSDLHLEVVSERTTIGCNGSSLPGPGERPHPV